MRRQGKREKLEVGMHLDFVQSIKECNVIKEKAKSHKKLL